MANAATQESSRVSYKILAMTASVRRAEIAVPQSRKFHNSELPQEPISQMPVGKGARGSNPAALYDDPPGPARSLLAGPFSGYALRWIVQRGGARVCSVD